MILRKLTSVVPLLLIGALTGSCCGVTISTQGSSSASDTGVPKVTHHSSIAGQTNPDSFLECTSKGVTNGETEKTIDASIAELCWHVDYNFGGLTPDYPIAACHLNDVDGYEFDSATDGYGCYSFVLLACIDGAYTPIYGQRDLQAVFAPIDSAAEAVNYARLLDPYDMVALWGFSVSPEDDSYFVDEVEDTYVVDTSEGYLVHLFVLHGGKPCWCGQMELAAVDVLVRRDGSVSVGPQTLVARAKEEICVD